MFDGDFSGTLLVFDFILAVLAVIMGENLRVRLKSVPQQAANQTQQLAAATAEIEATERENAQVEAEIADLQQQMTARRLSLAQNRKRLHEVTHRLPTTVYVLDQLIQHSHEPWLITVKRGDPAETSPGSPAAEWAAGRLFLVFGDDSATVRRRIEVRYPPAQGYRASEAQRFTLP